MRYRVARKHLFYPFRLDEKDPFYRKRSTKLLTNKHKFARLELVKLKRKDDKMASDKNKTSKIKGIVKAIAWTVFGVHQAFVCWLVITNFNNYIAVVASLVSLGLAVMAIGTVGAILGKTFNK